MRVNAHLLEWAIIICQRDWEGERCNVGNLLVTGVTFGVFMAEAIIHYNMGQATPDSGFQLKLPPPKELAKIALVTGAFSVTSGLLIGTLERRLGGKV
jgi:hypothetical protein